MGWKNLVKFCYNMLHNYTGVKKLSHVQTESNKTKKILIPKRSFFNICQTDSNALYTTIVGGIFVIAIVALWKKIIKLIIKIANFIKIKLFKKEAFEVLGLRKHVTICANGHLIVLHNFKLKINKKNSSEKFTRMFDISDGADKCKLPNLKIMLKTNKKNRFNTYGFWYRSNPENIFEEVKEIDPVKNNYKQRHFYFRFNKTVLSNLKNNAVKLMYGYAIRYGQPLTNGYFDYSLVENKSKKPLIMSQFKVQYKMDSLEYIFSYIDNVQIDKDLIKVFYYPDGADNAHTKEEHKFEQKDDLYYNKFVFIIKKPKLNSMIQIVAPVKIKED